MYSDHTYSSVHHPSNKTINHYWLHYNHSLLRVFNWIPLEVIKKLVNIKFHFINFNN